MKLLQGDCLELMKDIPDGSVDMILADLPYGTTRCACDVVIPFDPLWAEYKRIIKENGAIVLFSAEPFTSELIMSNRKMFRYDMIWQKNMASDFLNAKRKPLRTHENICVFYKRMPTYRPQMSDGGAWSKRDHRKLTDCYGEFRCDMTRSSSGGRYPTTVIRRKRETGSHPTQKPVPLLEYLIKTYTNPGELVLDNVMGSGSAGVACVSTGRDFIGMELDAGYFETACKRIKEAQEAHVDP